MYIYEWACACVRSGYMCVRVSMCARAQHEHAHGHEHIGMHERRELGTGTSGTAVWHRGSKGRQRKVRVVEEHVRLPLLYHRSLRAVSRR